MQSSSATTLAAIGFVNAELLTLEGALGFVYGANIGTTATAWIVSYVGLKVNASAFGLPMIAVGAALRLFGRGRMPLFGTALAGFGMLFHGIDLMQLGATREGGWQVPGGLERGHDAPAAMTPLVDAVRTLAAALAAPDKDPAHPRAAQARAGRPAHHAAGALCRRRRWSPHAQGGAAREPPGRSAARAGGRAAQGAPLFGRGRRRGTGHDSVVGRLGRCGRDRRLARALRR